MTEAFLSRRRLAFALPNSFTLASIFCGIYAIIHISGSDHPDAFYQSAMAIFFAGFFDMFDGRIARLTKTQSDFGIQLDSLADVISFGVAPAILVFRWSLWPMPYLGLLVAFCFVACGALRLARFNVAAQAHLDSGDFFSGLPIPLAAATLISLVMAHYSMFPTLNVAGSGYIAALVFVLSALMVSRVPYWSFKRFRFQSRAGLLLLAIFASWSFAAVLLTPGTALAILMFGYIVAGLGRFCLNHARVHFFGRKI